jgi:hypothetical protein
VEGDGVGDCETGESRDLVDDAMGVVGRGADKEDRVRIYEAAEFRDRDTVGRGGTGDGMKFDFEIGGGFVECGMGSGGDDPM